MRFKVRFFPDVDGYTRTEVRNAETGELVRGLRKVEFSHEHRKFPVLRLEIVCAKDLIDAEVETDGEVVEIAEGETEA